MGRIAMQQMLTVMPRLTGHATQGVNQLLKKSMQGSARYRSEMTVTQWRLMPNPGRFCMAFSVMTCPLI